jgi:hypothetical protein
MACSEDVRLRQIHEEVLRLCNINRQVLDGVRLRVAARRHRRDLLNARFKAANELYNHSVTCPECKGQRVKPSSTGGPGSARRTCARLEKVDRSAKWKGSSQIPSGGVQLS